jgi:hypothetical protein
MIANSNILSSVESSSIRAFPVNSTGYNSPECAWRGTVFMNLSQTTTESVRALLSSEPELVPYECCRQSGVLSFWDHESEDLYTFEDGHPV